ncbi:MAG: hypothetical protein LBE74_09290 [Treponema sp.]|nr:hypothetical protein [Treponema sp.]
MTEQSNNGMRFSRICLRKSGRPCLRAGAARGVGTGRIDKRRIFRYRAARAAL